LHELSDVELVHAGITARAVSSFGGMMAVASMARHFCALRLISSIVRARRAVSPCLECLR
jgi:hypothetical protein